MATDGVKIIDGDTAHDTYWGIMDLYDEGAGLNEICKAFPFPVDNYFDDFEYEIYSTAYALAIWEIGFMSPEVLKEIRNVIEKGICVKVWTREFDEKSGGERQKELDKLWEKISQENKNVRERKKYKVVTDFIFSINDVLIFKLDDGNYRVTILLGVRQYRGECVYKFGLIDYKSTIKPTIETITNSNILGRKVLNSQNMNIESILSIGLDELNKLGGLEVVLKNEAERTKSYTIGLTKIGVLHEDLVKFSSEFEKIGEIELKIKETGSLKGESSFEGFSNMFSDIDDYIERFKDEQIWLSVHLSTV